MPPTKRGIYHNLLESKYAVSNTEIAFFFSSRLYREKFMQKYKENREKLWKRINNVAETELNMNIIADVSLYKRIEKRGFFARLKGVVISCEDLDQYALREMTNKNTKDWFVIPERKSGEQLKIMI